MAQNTKITQEIPHTGVGVCCKESSEMREGQCTVRGLPVMCIGLCNC